MDFNDRSFLIAMGGSPVASFGAQGLFDLRSYYEAMEAFLASTETDRASRVQAVRDEMDTQMRNYLLHSENSLLWEDYFPSELRATVLVSIMSFFERYLNGVCTEVGILLRTKVSHKKLKGSSLDRARSFLIDLCSLNGPSVQSWETMKQFQQLRNLLVHNGGMLDTDQELKRAKVLVETMKGIEVSELGIDLEPSALRYVFEETDQFIDNLQNAVAKMCEHVKKFENET